MISQNINQVASDINTEIQRFQAGEITEDQMVISRRVDERATQAILQGQGTLPASTPGWIAYMELFSGGSTADLDRLIPRDGTTDNDRQVARAYLAANGKCGMGTTRNLANNVGTRLDR